MGVYARLKPQEAEHQKACEDSMRRLLMAMQEPGSYETRLTVAMTSRETFDLTGSAMTCLTAMRPERRFLLIARLRHPWVNDRTRLPS